MADDTPPDAQTSTPKKETVRITLPPKPTDVPVVKRETVRIQPPGTAPKSDSARLPGLGAVPPAPPSAPKPFVPPAAPKPPGAPAIPARPAAPGASMPKPPGPPPAPAPRPAPPAAAPGAAPKAAAYAEAPPVAMKAAAPKKETARISLPPESKPMPKATIKLQQTQPLAQAPAPTIRTAGATQVAAAGGESDAATGILSWVVFVLSLASCVLGYIAYSA
jgi:hypothetical protein